MKIKIISALFLASAVMASEPVVISDVKDMAQGETIAQFYESLNAVEYSEDAQEVQENPAFFFCHMKKCKPKCCKPRKKKKCC